MALLNNSIAGFQFLSLQGTVLPPMQETEMDQRPAVDGLEISQTGTKGRPFQLLSRVDCQSYETCLLTFDSYLSLLDGKPYSLTQGNVSTDTRGFKVIVLAVRIIRAVALSGGIGGLSGPDPKGLLECRWDLLARANDQVDQPAIAVFVEE